MYEYKVVYGSGSKCWSKLFQSFDEAAAFANEVRNKYACPVSINRREVKCWRHYSPVE